MFESRFSSCNQLICAMSKHIKGISEARLKVKETDTATHKFYSQSHWFFVTLGACSMLKVTNSPLFPFIGAFFRSVWFDKNSVWRKIKKREKNIKTKTFKMNTNKMLVFKCIFFYSCSLGAAVAFNTLYSINGMNSSADFTTFYVLCVCGFGCVSSFCFSSSFASSSRTKATFFSTDKVLNYYGVHFGNRTKCFGYYVTQAKNHLGNERLLGSRPKIPFINHVMK